MEHLVKTNSRVQSISFRILGSSRNSFVGVQEDYHLVVPDLRGFGESTHPGDVRSSGTIPDMVGDLVCILQHAGISSAVCVGYGLLPVDSIRSYRCPQPRLGNPNLLRGRAHASGPVPCCRRRCHTGKTRGHICDGLPELICGPPIVPPFCERFCTSRAPRRRTPETQLSVIFQPQDARSHC